MGDLVVVWRQRKWMGDGKTHQKLSRLLSRRRMRSKSGEWLMESGQEGCGRLSG